MASHSYCIDTVLADVSFGLFILLCLYKLNQLPPALNVHLVETAAAAVAATTSTSTTTTTTTTTTTIPTLLYTTITT